MIYKLGKLAPRIDERTLKLNTVFQPLAPAPRVLNADTITSNPMFGNDKWGDCVIAMRGHGTRRFEYFEQGKCINGSDKEILKEYWKEGGATCRNKHPDNGLVELDSLNSWRQKGWTFGGRHYDIYAFGDIDYTDEQELANTLYYLNGAFCGVALPKSAQDQEVWDVIPGPESKPGSWGGHAIYLPPVYDMDTGLWTCITWGQPKKMTTAFVKKYFDEAHGIVDNKDKWLGVNSPVDIQKLDDYLKNITN